MRKEMKYESKYKKVKKNQNLEEKWSASKELQRHKISIKEGSLRKKIIAWLHYAVRYPCKISELGIKFGKIMC